MLHGFCCAWPSICSGLLLLSFKANTVRYLSSRRPSHKRKFAFILYYSLKLLLFLAKHTHTYTGRLVTIDTVKPASQSSHGMETKIKRKYVYSKRACWIALLLITVTFPFRPKYRRSEKEKKLCEMRSAVSSSSSVAVAATAALAVSVTATVAILSFILFQSTANS